MTLLLFLFPYLVHLLLAMATGVLFCRWLGAKPDRFVLRLVIGYLVCLGFLAGIGHLLVPGSLFPAGSGAMMTIGIMVYNRLRAPSRDLPKRIGE